jgi:hypothetical protein
VQHSSLDANLKKPLPQHVSGYSVVRLCQVDEANVDGWLGRVGLVATAFDEVVEQECMMGGGMFGSESCLGRPANIVFLAPVHEAVVDECCV